MRETWKNSVENIVEYGESNTQLPEVFWPEQRVWKCTNTRVQTHTHIPKTPKSQHLPPALPSCSDVPALPGQENVTFSTFTHKCDPDLCGCETWQPEKSCFLWWMLEEAKLTPDKGQGRVLNDGTEVLMRYLAKSTDVAAVIPRAGGFRSHGRGIRKTQSLPPRKTSSSLFSPGV